MLDWARIALQILGIHMNWGLEGILLVQVYIYSARFSSDPLRIKCLVYGVFIYETVQACLLVADVFHYWVWNYGDPAVLATLSNMWFSVLIMGGILATLVQCFYAWRIWNTVKHVFISVPIITVRSRQHYHAYDAQIDTDSR
ncbi:uncharacterized protein B0H18DRAFT_1155479 [Fomitopsis serialis]|uniref:uncharacterized protein n=1 Tax=Fomitopsis serialis TaxID=139415 RepID=UPI00200775FD|nr:uncharacterized protein B0H18DRAFT_1155479 [Neoantrodia serialis]KAH9928889.1 hypothetical protein B0H18DRAFT_1155479 [Neoantrodia serialis]